VRTLVVSPHPDDETLGCGGTLLRRRAEGVDTGWLIVTDMSVEMGWPAEAVQARSQELVRVAAAFEFSDVFNIGLPPERLDTVPARELVNKIGTAFKAFQPDEVLVPFRWDAHTDHKFVFDAVAACSKWFRYPFVRRVMAYETLSETDFGLSAPHAFQPNWFVDISDHVDRKVEIMSIYSSELGGFPFPRSAEAIRALAALRGAAAGARAAEAFQLLRHRE
jgi:LmbE family N-acetylglucosaminyl deacetylase